MAERSNHTRVTRLILRGFVDSPELRVAAVLFSFIYLFSLLRNVSIMVAVTRDSCLHTPMYFFLKNLSFLYACCTSVIVPRAVVSGMAGSEKISFLEYVAQFYLFRALVSTECFLLMAMAYDHCLAIHRPLLYGAAMSQRLCSKLVVTAWVSRAVYSAFHMANTFSLPFCGPNVVENFYDIPAVVRLACTDFHPRELVHFAVSSCVIMSAFLFTVLSYVGIVSTVARMTSVYGWWKAFSTCPSHLTTVLFYGMGSFMYLRPASQYCLAQARLASIFYSVCTPRLNPLIYCLRNQDMKVALQRLYWPRHR